MKNGYYVDSGKFCYSVEFYDSDKSGDSVKTGGNSCESSDNGDFGDSCKSKFYDSCESGDSRESGDSG